MPFGPTGGRPLPDPADAFAALRLPHIKAFAAGRITAAMGVQMVTLSVGWMLYERTGDAWALAFTGLVEILPVLFLMIPAGALADRFPRQRIALVSHAISFAAACGFLAAAVTDAPLWIIYALLLLVGASRAVAAPSIGAMLPELAPPAYLLNANAWISTSWELATILGPALAGALIGMSGNAHAAFVGAAVLQLAATAFMLLIPATTPGAGRPVGRSAADLFAGLRFLVRARPMLGAMIADLFAVLLAGAVALLPIFAKDVLGVGPAGLGWLRAAPAIGALGMALLTTRLRPWKRPGHVLVASIVVFGVATVAFGLSRNLWLSLACLVAIGAADTVSVVIRRTLEQVLTPDHLRGRVGAVRSVFVGFSNELGAFESGAAAALLGPVAAVVAGGIAACGVAYATYRWFPELMALPPLHTLEPLRISEAAPSPDADQGPTLARP